MTVNVLGADRLARLLTQLGRGASIDVIGALVEEGEELMAISKDRFVPVDQRTLSLSGFVRISTVPVGVEVGFGGPAAPYALAVHENPRSGKTGGRNPDGSKRKTWAAVGQWKYLSTPFKQRKPGMARRVARRVATRFRARMRR